MCAHIEVFSCGGIRLREIYPTSKVWMTASLSVSNTQKTEREEGQSKTSAFARFLQKPRKAASIFRGGSSSFSAKLRHSP
jgi:hypothetical protein